MRSRSGLAVLSILVLITCTIGGREQVAQGANALTLPTGFADTTLVNGLLSPRDFVFANDGRLIIAVRGGNRIYNSTLSFTEDINYASIRVFKNGALQPYPPQSFNVCGDGERGLLGLALDPNFAVNSYVYVYYTSQGTTSSCGYNQAAAGPRNRVARVTLNADDSITNEQVLLDNMPSDSGIHNSGALRFGADGNLYITAGDGGTPTSPAQDLASLGGKMLRIRPDVTDPKGYTIPSSNPFASDPSGMRCGVRAAPVAGKKCQEIFAYGLRNPFRMTIKPGTSTPYAFDVGGGFWEEIDEVAAGGNYGWPSREGPCAAGVNCVPPSSPGPNDPIYAYAHVDPTNNNNNAIIGGAFYTGSTYPAIYANSLFFADFNQGWLRQLTYNSGTGTWSAANFASGGGSLIGVRAGVDTNLYYLTVPGDTNGEIHKISYTGASNQAPIANISVDTTGGPLNTVYTFSAAGSKDPDGSIVSYRWDFGDGNVSITAAPTVTHVYGTAGTKTVALTVTDNGTPPATSQAATLSIFPANLPPTGTIVLTNLTDASRADRYYAGDTWQFAAANLSDDTTPTQNLRLDWKVVFQHREHWHPFLEYATGSNGQFTIPTIGERDYAVWYRVYLTISDAEGQSTEIMKDLFPQQTNITFVTEPANGNIVMDGQVITATASITRVVGIEIPFEAPESRVVSGATYTFARWSNSGLRAQVVPVPVAGATYTATYANTVTPVTTTPVTTTPVTTTPVTTTPVTTTPVTTTPVTTTPVTTTPVTTTPVTTTPVTTTPVTTTPVTTTPVTTTPVTTTPVTTTPVTVTPVTTTPDMPTSGTPTSGTPTSGTPTSGTPTSIHPSGKYMLYAPLITR